MVLTAEEFDAFISGDEAELLEALGKNEDFSTWFAQAGYLAFEPPKG